MSSLALGESCSKGMPQMRLKASQSTCGKEFTQSEEKRLLPTTMARVVLQQKWLFARVYLYVREWVDKDQHRKHLKKVNRIVLNFKTFWNQMRINIPNIVCQDKKDPVLSFCDSIKIIEHAFRMPNDFGLKHNITYAAMYRMKAISDENFDGISNIINEELDDGGSLFYVQPILSFGCYTWYNKDRFDKILKRHSLFWDEKRKLYNFY